MICIFLWNSIIINELELNIHFECRKAFKRINTVLIAGNIQESVSNINTV